MGFVNIVCKICLPCAQLDRIQSRSHTATAASSHASSNEELGLC